MWIPIVGTEQVFIEYILSLNVYKCWIHVTIENIYTVVTTNVPKSHLQWHRQEWDKLTPPLVVLIIDFCKSELKSVEGTIII